MLCEAAPGCLPEASALDRTLYPSGSMCSLFQAGEVTSQGELAASGAGDFHRTFPNRLVAV